jgi:C1A family cysteine protease
MDRNLIPLNELVRKMKMRNAKKDSKMCKPLSKAEMKAVGITKKVTVVKAKKVVKVILPTVVDLSYYNSTIYDQGALGSCTANAFCTAFRMQYKMKHGDDYFPSRLAVYYYERQMEGSINYDVGADVADGQAYVKVNGITSESVWPYIVSKFAMEPILTDAQKLDALNYKIKQYYYLSIDLNSIKQALLLAIPVLIGMMVYSNFFSIKKNGILAMPGKKDYIIGGHELVIVGYDDKKKLFKVANSWGTSFGNSGYIYIPYAYLGISVLQLTTMSLP